MESCAFLGQRERAGRAVDQAHTEPLLQPGELPADDSQRHMQLTRSG
jgi:hypothetical protein